MFFMPESPYYLVAKGKNDQALKSLQWLRGSENAKDVLEEVKREFREQKLIGSVSYVNLFTDSVYLRPFLIVMALMFFQQFSGINAVFFYLKVSSSINIFRQRFINRSRALLAKVSTFSSKVTVHKLTFLCTGYLISKCDILNGSEG